MHIFARALLPLAALGALSACATTDGGTDVTRFHLNQQMTRGTVFLEPATTDRADSLEFRQYADAVARELAAAGFEPVTDRANAQIIGTVDYAQTTREAIAGRSPVSIGVGGGTFGRNSGISLGTSFGLGGKPKDIKVSMLELRLAKASDQSPVWEGRALSEAREGTDTSALSAAIPQLARDLMRDFPGESGKTTTYRN